MVGTPYSQQICDDLLPTTFHQNAWLPAKKILCFLVNMSCQRENRSGEDAIIVEPTV